MQKELQVKASLNEELTNKFLELKEYYRIDADAEIFRLCIADAYRVMIERKKLAKSVKKENIEDS